MRDAPAMRAPWTAEMPTPPRPVTTTVEPRSTLAVLSTAPTPVCTAQPIRQATSRGMSSSRRTAPEAGTTVCWANAPTPRPRCTSRPARENGDVLSGRVPATKLMACGQRLACWRAQPSQCPHGASGVIITLSPSDTWPTASPTADHHSGRLVTQHSGDHVAALDDGEVAVADAAVAHGHAHLARPGISQLQVVDHLQRRRRIGQQCGSHRVPTLLRSADGNWPAKCTPSVHNAANSATNDPLTPELAAKCTPSVHNAANSSGQASKGPPLVVGPTLASTSDITRWAASTAAVGAAPARLDIR